MATTTAEKQRRLEDAWDATAVSRLNLRDQLRSFESAQGKLIAGGSQASVSANGRHTQFANHGPGQSTPQEIAECYRELIGLYDESAKWLRACNRNLLDTFNAELCGFAPAASPVNPGTLKDDTGKWAELCAQFNVDASLIGSDLTDGSRFDDACFMWMMDHLFAVAESRSDYSGALVGSPGRGWWL